MELQETMRTHKRVVSMDQQLPKVLGHMRDGVSVALESVPLGMEVGPKPHRIHGTMVGDTTAAAVVAAGALTAVEAVVLATHLRHGRGHKRRRQVHLGRGRNLTRPGHSGHLGIVR